MPHDPRIVELQAHTEYSDGSGLDDVLGAAHARGLHSLAITDHHEVAAISEAIEKIERHDLGIEIIPGIEFSTNEGPHLLGLFIDYKCPTLRIILQVIHEARRDISEERLEKFRNYPLFRNELNLDMKQLLDLTPTRNICASHFELLIYNKISALFANDQDTYKRAMKQLTEEIACPPGQPIVFHPEADFHSSYGLPYISNMIRNNMMKRNTKCHVKMHHALTVANTVEHIHTLGGVAVWAHPGQPRFDDELEGKILAAGVDAIDAYSSKHTSDDNQRYDEMAKANGLVSMMSSDYHGRYTPHLTIGQVHGRDIPYSIVEELMESRDRVRVDLEDARRESNGRIKSKRLSTSGPDKSPSSPQSSE